MRQDEASESILVEDLTGQSDVAGFDSASYLLFKLDTVTSSSPKDLLTMNFKSLHNSGVLMHMEGNHGHTVSLELLKGKLFIHLRKGNFHIEVSLGSLLDDQHWHLVSIERLRGHVNFTVDKSTQQLQLPDHLSHFEINEGNVTFACSEAVDVPVTFDSSESFLQLLWTSTRDTLSVGLQFRTWNKAGLLMTFDLHHQAGTLWVYLSEARARMQVHKAGRLMADITAAQDLRAANRLRNDAWLQNHRRSLRRDPASDPPASLPLYSLLQRALACALITFNSLIGASASGDFRPHLYFLKRGKLSLSCLLGLPHYFCKWNESVCPALEGALRVTANTVGGARSHGALSTATALTPATEEPRAIAVRKQHLFILLEFNL
ncbi:contactin-associated protein-like 4 isoform X1 [Tachysurus ichikawai]